MLLNYGCVLFPMRLFLAVNIPESVKQYLGEVQESLKGHEGRITWVKPENMHFTLKFLGDVEEGKVDAITEKMSKIPYAPFSVELTDIGTFPSPSSPTVVWVGVKDETPLFELHKLVDLSL